LEADVSAADGQGQSEESAKRRVTELAGNLAHGAGDWGNKSQNPHPWHRGGAAPRWDRRSAGKV